MRNTRNPFLIISIALALLLAGCSKGASLSGVLMQHGISEKSAEGMKVELRFLLESRGSNYKFTDLTGNKALISQIMGFLQKSKPAIEPAGQYTPEIKSDYEIVFTASDGKSLTVYYAVKDNYLIYPDTKTDKNGETLEYLYYTPETDFATLISGQDKNAALTQANDVKPFRSLEELKSAIDPDELAEAGTAIDFQFFTDATPPNTGTACRIYTNSDFNAVPQDSYLITAYGKSKAGQQEKLSITAMEANTNYTKITAEEPDDTLDSVDTGADAEAPQSYAVIVKKAAIDPGKWIVFVDDKDAILDVIPPESIVTASGQPVMSLSPSGTPEPSGTVVATATTMESSAEASESPAPTDDASADEN